jgi:hypothetical protein
MTPDEDIDISDIPDTDREEALTVDDVDSETTDESAASEGDADENLNENDSDTEDHDGEDEDDNEDQDEDDDQDDKASHRNPRVERRIAKEVAKRKAIEETLKAKDTELKTLRDTLAEAKGSGKTYASLADVTLAKQKLRKELDQIEDAIDDGGFERQDGTTIDVKTLKGWRRQIREEIEDALPAAERRLLRQEEVNREQVSKLYPELLSPSSAMAREAEQIFARVPALRGDPEAFLLVGDLLRGRKLRMKFSGGKKPAPKPPESRSPNAARSVRSSRSKPDDDFAAISQALAEYT